MTDRSKQPLSQPIHSAVDTQGARRATGVSTAGAVPRPSGEVLEKAARRRFGANYKQRILTEVDACVEPGAIGKLLRREGLYSSHLSKWRAQRDETVRAGRAKPKGRKPPETGLLALENVRLQKENQRLQGQLTQALTILDVQKKLSQLLKLAETPTDARTSS